MTVSATDNRKEYSGNGTTVSFASPVFHDDADINVYLVDSSGSANLWALNTEYTLSGKGNASGGTVTVATSPTDYTPQTGETLIVLVDPALVQGLDLVDNDPLPADSVERSFDVLTVIAQRLKSLIDRSFSFSDTAAGVDGVSTDIPTPAAGQALVWDNPATKLKNLDLALIGALAVSTFAKTLLDDTTADEVWDTLMATINKADARSDLAVAGLTDENVFTKMQTWARGSDLDDSDITTNILTLGDGNFFHVAGTTSIAGLGNESVGTPITIVFDTSRTLTHHASNFILPTGADITTQAGDSAKFITFASGQWRCVQYLRSTGQPVSLKDRLVQRVIASTGSVATGTTLIPKDNTTPQSTEGDQYLTLSITPKKAGNKIIVDIVANVCHSVSGAQIAAALFKNSGTSAVAVGAHEAGQTDKLQQIRILYEDTAADTSTITYKLRIGGSAAGTTTVNGVSSGSAHYNGTALTTILAEEMGT